MSRGKLPHISRRASAMSSSVMWVFKSAHNPSKLRRGFFAPPFFSFRKSTKSNTSFCFSGGKSRSFSTTCCSIVMAASRAISLYYAPLGAISDFAFGQGSYGTCRLHDHGGHPLKRGRTFKIVNLGPPIQPVKTRAFSTLTDPRIYSKTHSVNDGRGATQRERWRKEEG